MKTQKSIDITLLITRLIVGAVVFAHGAQKLFGWFGGYGFEGSMGFFINDIGLPYIFAFLIIIAESLGMIALIAGFLSRIVSGALVLIMLGAIVTTHFQYGFFMNWEGAQPGEGFEFHLLVIALSLVTVLNGAGSYSVDHVLLKTFRSKAAQPLFG
jgi:putative oxidoreductase